MTNCKSCVRTSHPLGSFVTAEGYSPALGGWAIMAKNKPKIKKPAIRAATSIGISNPFTLFALQFSDQSVLPFKVAVG